MKTSHLSPWEQEEYVMRERTPQMMHHLAECLACRAEVEKLEQGVSLFRNAAVEWSAERMAHWPATRSLTRRLGFPVRWAFAAAIPLVLLVLALFGFPRSNRPPLRPAAAISDDALLDQVDEQLSVAVPSSMESLTHLVESKSAPASGNETAGGHQNVQSN